MGLRLNPIKPAGVAVVLILATLPVSAADAFIAGVDPSQRPAGAPTISAPQRAPDWKARAERGITDPKPASLKFLDNQGSWYTPFDHPGMPGRYDIRRLHGG
jgi:hypothetical protein